MHNNSILNDQSLQREFEELVRDQAIEKLPFEGKKRIVAILEKHVNLFEIPVFNNISELLKCSDEEIFFLVGAYCGNFKSQLHILNCVYLSADKQCPCNALYLVWMSEYLRAARKDKKLNSISNFARKRGRKTNHLKKFQRKTLEFLLLAHVEELGIDKGIREVNRCINSDTDEAGQIYARILPSVRADYTQIRAKHSIEAVKARSHIFANHKFNILSNR